MNIKELKKLNRKELLEILLEQAKVIEKLENDLDSNDNLDNKISDTILIDGYNYIGIIEIPSINLKLPVMTTFDYDKLKIAPCIYYGSI